MSIAQSHYRFRVKAEATSIGWLESSKHRKVTHVCGEQVGLEQKCGGGDQVVGIVNAAVGAAVALGERAGCPCHLLADGHPGQRREELLERLDLSFANAGQELEANDLAREKNLFGFDQAAE